MTERIDWARQSARYEADIGSLSASLSSLRKSLESSSKLIEHQQNIIADLQSQLSAQKKEFHDTLPHNLQKCINQLVDIKNQAFVFLTPNVIQETLTADENDRLPQSSSQQSPNINKIVPSSTISPGASSSAFVSPTSTKKSKSNHKKSNRSLKKVQAVVVNAKSAVNNNSIYGDLEHGKDESEQKYSETNEFRSIPDLLSMDSESSDIRNLSVPMRIKLISKKCKSSKKRSHKKKKTPVHIEPLLPSTLKPVEESKNLNKDSQPSTSSGIIKNRKRKSENSHKKKSVKKKIIEVIPRRSSSRKESRIIDLVHSDSENHDFLPPVNNGALLKNDSPPKTKKNVFDSCKSSSSSKKFPVEDMLRMLPKIVLVDFLKEEKLKNSDILESFRKGHIPFASSTATVNSSKKSVDSMRTTEIGPPHLIEELQNDDSNSNIDTIIPDIVNNIEKQPELKTGVSAVNQNDNGMFDSSDSFGFDSGVKKDDVCDSSFFRLLQEVSMCSPGISPNL